MGMSIDFTGVKPGSAESGAVVQGGAQ